MDDGETDDRQRPGKRRGLAVGVGCVGLGLAALWWQRAPIATQIIDRELAKRGVPARYAIARLGPNGAELAGLIIGDPAAPDLVARQVGVTIGWRLTGAYIRKVTIADGWARGALNDRGELSFGTLDRLRPAPGSEPFALPDLDMRLHNVRLRLATPAGMVGLAAEGDGNLASGFNGRAALSAPRIRRDDCRLVGGQALFDIRIRDRVITAGGPASLSSVRCGGTGAGPVSAIVSAMLPETLDRVEGSLNLSARALASEGNGAAALASAEGRYSFVTAKSAGGFDGTVRWEDLAAADAWRNRIAQSAKGLAATPLGPLAEKATQALDQALREIDGSARVLVKAEGSAGQVDVTDLGLRSASTAQLTTTGKILNFSWPAGLLTLDGTMALSGGGLPDTRVTVQSKGRGVWTAYGSIAPYAAGSARLTLSPVQLDWNGHAGRLATLAELDGPLAGGAIKALKLPLDVRFSTSGAVALMGRNGCLDAGFASLAAGGVRLGPTRLPLCAAQGDTLFALGDDGRLTGDVRAKGLTLAGAMDDAPVTVSAENLRLTAAGTTAAPRLSFGLGASDVRMKRADGDTWLRFANLSGEGNATRLEGRLDDAAGAIAGVPLLVDQANGRWRYAGGVLSLDAPAARVQDAAAAERRFEPVSARGIRLALKNGVITGDAVIAHPANGKQLALVDLRHNLSRMDGDARLRVPELMFGDDLQPEQLTPLTRGIIANVGGEIHGQGDIRWNARGVTSDGVFESKGIGLSAAFGLVHNIKGRIVFDDLLGMTTPPGQVATIGEMNPGVAVKDGVIRYQLLPEQHVKVEEGRWPFAAGDLILEPTVLDFSKPTDRIFAMTVVGLDAAQFIQQFEFKNIAVSGLFDGRLPLLFNETGGRIVGGRLVARQEGGKLAYVGELSEADIGGAGKLAFDALKSLKYKALIIEMDGDLDGEIISTVLFNGTNETPVNPTGSALPVRATGLPFKFNITVKAPFRALMNTAESFTDVRTTVRQALPPDTSEVPGAAPVQPQDSEKTP